MSFHKFDIRISEYQKSISIRLAYSNIQKASLYKVRFPSFARGGHLGTLDGPNKFRFCIKLFSVILYWTIRAFSKISILSGLELICKNMKIWIYMSLNWVIQNRSDGSSSIHIQKLCAKFEPIWSSRTTQVPPSGNQGGTAFPSMKFPVVLKYENFSIVLLLFLVIKFYAFFLPFFQN